MTNESAKKLTEKRRFNPDYKNLSDEHLHILVDVAERNNAEHYTDILKILIESHSKSTRPSGARVATIDKIHDAVTSQMKLNLETTKTITVGTGRNKREVKYEQRSITQKWIMEEAGAAASSIKQYLSEHADELEAHHKEIGLLTPKDVRNYNRSTGKASDRVEKGLA